MNFAYNAYFDMIRELLITNFKDKKEKEIATLLFRYYTYFESPTSNNQISEYGLAMKNCTNVFEWLMNNADIEKPQIEQWVNNNKQFAKEISSNSINIFNAVLAFYQANHQLLLFGELLKVDPDFCERFKVDLLSEKPRILGLIEKSNAELKAEKDNKNIALITHSDIVDICEGNLTELNRVMRSNRMPFDVNLHNYSGMVGLSKFPENYVEDHKEGVKKLITESAKKHQALSASYKRDEKRIKAEVSPEKNDVRPHSPKDRSPHTS